MGGEGVEGSHTNLATKEVFKKCELVEKASRFLNFSLPISSG